MGILEKYHCGIDPGATGGIGIIDSRGQFVSAHRWDRKNPARLYSIILLLKGMVDDIYIELIQTFPQKDVGFITRNQATLVNFGQWQGMLIAAGLPFVTISPLTWQSKMGLTSWQKKQKDGIVCHSPLSLARSIWPDAPMEHEADSGKAVGLLLADLARRDSLAGIDRAAIQAQAKAKAKAKAKALRRMSKL